MLVSCNNTERQPGLTQTRRVPLSLACPRHAGPPQPCFPPTALTLPSYSNKQHEMVTTNPEPKERDLPKGFFPQTLDVSLPQLVSPSRFPHYFYSLVLLLKYGRNADPHLAHIIVPFSVLPWARKCSCKELVFTHLFRRKLDAKKWNRWSWWTVEWWFISW